MRSEVRGVATRWVSDDQPGWIEVVVTAVTGGETSAIDKVPYLTRAALTANSGYPTDVWMRCERLAEPTADTVRVRLTDMDDAEIEVRRENVRPVE